MSSQHSLTKKTLRSGSDLSQENLIGDQEIAQSDSVGENFSIAVPPHLANLIEGSSETDPIARQFLPSVQELVDFPEEKQDPIGDHEHSPVKGVVHRYPDRVLFKPIHVCPVYCRFCFRREQVGKGGEALSKDEMEAAFQYIESQPNVWEVILSGGDPLVLSNRKLKALVERLNQIEHVEIIRIHTRYPIAEPGRIDAEFIDALKGKATVYTVLHCNHPRELTEETLSSCALMIDAGIPLLSQTVLLNGVNDTTETMTALMRALVRARIKPYYLHHLDLARGTHHFRKSIEQGQELMQEMRGNVSGLCQPQYVLDIPGGHGKVPIGPSYLSSEEDRHVVLDYKGDSHVYP